MASPDDRADAVLWRAKRGRLPYGGIPGERELVELAKAGDSSALEELCSSHWAGIYSMVEASIKNSAAAEEVTQEVFERAIRSLPNFEYTGAPFSAYLTRIARNLIHDRWRSQSRRRLVQSDLADLDIADTETPEDRAVSRSDLALLRIALGKLSDNHRRVLYLRLVEGLSAEQTAQRMGRRSDAVRQLQRRALEALRVEVERIERK